MKKAAKLAMLPDIDAKCVDLWDSQSEGELCV